jgi:luciferase family oxidoreductase group 1
MPGIASAATSVVIGHVAGATQSIRVGSGGVMLPNHAPLVIAEQFGTLEAAVSRPDRPRARPRSRHRCRRRAGAAAFARNSGDTFPQDVLELQAYLAPADARQRVQAVPGNGARVPLYLLGSSDFSARLAAELGLPFAFASHFAPDYLKAALALYRHNFRPSPQLQEPYVIVGAGVYAAETDAEARRLFTSAQLMTKALISGAPTQLPPPVESIEGHLSPFEREAIEHRTRYTFVGSAETIRTCMEQLHDATAADEIMILAQIYDHAARLRSFEIAAAVFREMNGKPAELPG